MTAKPAQPQTRPIFAAVAIATLFAASLASAASTDLADVPLANSSTLAIPPNIAVVIDDSGSMDEENMPDSNNTNKTRSCYKWRNYNTLAYNPGRTYQPPMKANGSRFPDAIFTAALKDGYFASGQKMYDGSTTNTALDLTTLGTYYQTYSRVWMPDFGSYRHYATSVTVTLLDNSVIELLGSSPVPTSSTTNEDSVGTAIANAINANTDNTGFTATYSSSSVGSFSGTLRIYTSEAQIGLATTPTVTLVKTTAGGSVANPFENAFSTFTFENGIYYSTHATDTSSTSCDDDSAYTTVTLKSNIAAPGATAGSADALTNYANWYSYYRKRAFLMKAGVGEAFAALSEDKYRVGYFTIDSLDSEVELQDGQPVNHDLKIGEFSGTASGTHRANWFDRLYGTREALYTPLRGALSRMGRIYSGKVSGWDPVQYSCQRNFTILTTDGYWNTNAEDSDYGPFKMNNSTSVGDQDGVSGVTRPELDSSKKSSTLADVAYYYYHTDLRDEALGNCDGALRPDNSTGKVCENDVFTSGTSPTEDDVATHQHMTTYTLGLGVDGTLEYQSDYRTATSGDYKDIRQGTKNWPDPIANSGGERIDDLWHAAVNGRGLYLSARDPDSLTSGLSAILRSIDRATGSGAAAATASLQPTMDDSQSNRIYIASYTTVDWYGDVSAYSIDLDNGTISSSSIWDAGELLDSRIGISGDSDGRTIYVDVAGTRKPFRIGEMTAAQQAYFDNTKLDQYSDWSSTDQSTATGELLVNYLRGHNRYEDQNRDTDFGTYARLYRDRAHVLGDMVHSQPVYVKNSVYNFGPGYDPTHGGRMGMLYVAANDGMLHAFCTESVGDCSPGRELWAFVIPMALKNMWYLADKRHADNHHFMVDGPIAVSDAYINGGWKTILVGAMGKGGRGYYAFDITSPTNPQLLWTFSAEGPDDIANTTDDNPNVGYSYGTPMITKVDSNGDLRGDNTEWRVLLPSGYNNVPGLPESGNFTTADGGGYLFVVDAGTGSLVSTISTSTGSATSPSGFANVSIRVPDFETDNTALDAYGGDLEGNMWRFDLGNGTTSKVIGLGSSHPITTAPEIGEVDGGNALFFGTGRYLGQTDLSTADQQYIIGVKASASNLTLGDLVQQTGADEIDWSTGNGWYLALTGGKERVNLAPQLYFGTLIFATTLPTGTECRPDGSGRLYFVNYSSGTRIDDDTPLYMTFSAPLVGVSVVKLPSGTPKVIPITSKGEYPEGSPPDLPMTPGLTEDSGTRIMWRELID